MEYCADRPLPSLFRPFDTSSFMPRINCGNWPEWLVGSWVVPSVGLMVLYLLIAAFLLMFYARSSRTTFPRRWLPWIAASFVGCGGGHAMNALAFLWPAYVAYVLWDWYTLVVSVVGTVGVWRIKVWGREQIRVLESGLHHALDDKNHAEIRADLAREAQREAEERLRKKFELDFAQYERKAQELDRIREELGQLLNKQFTEAAYLSLRERLHIVRGTLT